MDDDELRRLIERVRAISRSIDDEAHVRLAAQARGLVADWRWADATSRPHRGNEPWWAIRHGARGGWLSRPAEQSLRVGLDDRGRPLLAELQSFGEPWVEEVWVHDDDNGEALVVEGWIGGTGPRIVLLAGPPGRVETLVSALCEGEEVAVECWTWRDGVAVRGDCAEVSLDGFVRAQAYEARVGEDGRLALRSGLEERGPLAEEQIGGERLVDVLLDALGNARALDGDVHVPDPARDGERPPPLRPSAELVDVLAGGLGDAVRAALAAAGVERPFVVEHAPGPLAEGSSPLLLPGSVLIGSERFRDRMRRFSADHGQALRLLWKGEPADGAVRVELATHCDAGTLSACREVGGVLALGRDPDGPECVRARSALDAVAARLTVELNGAHGVGSTAEPFLVLVDAGDPYAERDPLGRARRVLGARRVEQFVASLASVVGDEAALRHEAARDRDALERWLRARGLGGPPAKRIAHDVARSGIRLATADDRARSRIGGPGLLAPGAVWPQSCEGSPLSCLAALDLGELEPAGVEGLPHAGWLLFFADLDELTGEPTINDEDALARVLWVEAGARPVAAAPPAARGDEWRHQIAERRVRGLAQLTLADGMRSGEELGLDLFESVAYDEIAYALRFGLPVTGDPGAWDEIGGPGRGPLQALDDDWLLGDVSGVQGHDPDPGTVLLLHLSSVEFADAGSIQFRIPPQALAARDWSQIRAYGDSH